MKMKITAQYLDYPPLSNYNETFWMNAMFFGNHQSRGRIGNGSMASFISYWNKRMGWKGGANKTAFFWRMVEAGKIKVLKIEGSERRKAKLQGVLKRRVRGR